ncbi:unnamed protein product, partial [marine sediment metagenome]
GNFGLSMTNAKLILPEGIPNTARRIFIMQHLIEPPLF